MRAIDASKQNGVSLGRLGLWLVAAGTMIGGGSAGVRAGSDDPARKPDPITAGYEIFNREWMPNDPRGHGGDGLGPVFNDSSCVACHNSGGSGGAGPVSKNIDILSASRNNNFMAPPAPAQVEESPRPGRRAGCSADGGRGSRRGLPSAIRRAA